MSDHCAALGLMLTGEENVGELPDMDCAAVCLEILGDEDVPEEELNRRMSVTEDDDAPHWSADEESESDNEDH